MKTYPASGEIANPMHPGEFLAQVYLEPLELTLTTVTEALGISHESLDDLVRGRSTLTPELALRLEAAFGRSAESWLILQRSYDLNALKTAREQVDVSQVKRLYTPSSL